MKGFCYRSVNLSRYPTLPPSTPKNKDLAKVTPAMIFCLLGRELRPEITKFTTQLTPQHKAQMPIAMPAPASRGC